VNRSPSDTAMALHRTCPACGGTLEYQQNAPMLSVQEANARQPQQRLCYVSGWFCSNSACEYQESVERIK